MTTSPTDAQLLPKPPPWVFTSRIVAPVIRDAVDRIGQALAREQR
jgi:hypothetical protein